MEGRKQIKLADVCAAAGVSTATVSRVLNNQPGVGAALRAKVLAKMRELDYVPRAAARNLSRAKSDTIGLVFQDLTPGFLLTVFRGIMNRASSSGYHVLTALSTEAGDEMDLPQRLLAERRVDGLIWYDPRATARGLGALMREHVPFVLLQKRAMDPAVNTVCIECEESAAELMRHLLALGHRRILLVTGAETDEDSMRKLDSVLRVARQHGVKIPAGQIVVGHHVGGHAVRALEAYMEAGGKKPDAILAFNDDMALAIITWLRRRGLRVPQDVAVVGFDGVAEAEAQGLTTIETPMYDMGVLAMQILIDRLSGTAESSRARQVVLKGRLVVRHSCGAGQKRR